MTGRRSPVGAVVGCALGGLIMVLASGRRWAHTEVVGPSGAGRTALSATGHVVEPALPALAIALLALAGATLASSGVIRRVVGLVVVIVGAAGVSVAVAGHAHVSTALEHHEVGVQGVPVHASANGWWVVALIGALLATASGIVVVFRARQWAGLSAKYDAPSKARPPRDPAVAAWDALDRGEDPTA